MDCGIIERSVLELIGRRPGASPAMETEIDLERWENEERSQLADRLYHHLGDGSVGGWHRVPALSQYAYTPG